MNGNDGAADIAECRLPRYHWTMRNSRIIVLATCCALAARAWAGAGLTSAGVDPTVGNNAQAEPTLAQVAPVTNQQGQPGGGTSAGVVLPATGAGGAAQAGGAAGQRAASGAAGDASKPATPVVVAPAPPPPPPDPSTLPVSVIRPLNKTPESAPPPAAESVSTSTASKTKPTRQPLASEPAEPVAARPPPPRVVQAAPARADTTRAAGDTPATPAAANSATADGSANGYVFYTGVGIAGIILALSFAGFMRAGNSESGRPRV